MTILKEVFESILAILMMVLLYIPILILHEFGHWIIFRFAGYKAKFKINLTGDFEIGRNVHDKVNLIISVISIFSGILLGALPFLFYKMFLPSIIIIALAIIYAIGIQQDLMTFQMIVTFKGKSWKKATLFDVNEYHYRKYVESVNNGGND